MRMAGKWFTFKLRPSDDNLVIGKCLRSGAKKGAKDWYDRPLTLRGRTGKEITIPSMQLHEASLYYTLEEAIDATNGIIYL